MGCQATCDSCNMKCQTCQGCYSCQTYCQTNQCPETTFNFSACVQSGEIIGPGYFDLDVWNEAIDRINTIRTEATYGNGTKYAQRTATHVTHTEFNAVKDILGATIYENIDENIVKDSQDMQKDIDIVKGVYFQSLEKAVTNYNYLATQCDWCNNGCQSCNSGCNASCNGCNGCNTQCCQCCDAHSDGGTS